MAGIEFHIYSSPSIFQPFNHTTLFSHTTPFVTPNPSPLEVLKSDLSLGDGQDAQLIPAGLKLMRLGNVVVVDEKRRYAIYIIYLCNMYLAYMIYIYIVIVWYMAVFCFFRYHFSWPKLDLHYHFSTMQLPSTVITFIYVPCNYHLPGNLIKWSRLVLNAIT